MVSAIFCSFISFLVPRPNLKLLNSLFYCFFPLPKFRKKKPLDPIFRHFHSYPHAYLFHILLLETSFPAIHKLSFSFPSSSCFLLQPFQISKQSSKLPSHILMAPVWKSWSIESHWPVGSVVVVGIVMVVIRDFEAEWLGREVK